MTWISEKTDFGILPSNHQLKIKIISQFETSPVYLRIFLPVKKSTNQHLSEALYHMTTKYIDTMHAWWTTFIFLIWIKTARFTIGYYILTILNCQIINQNLPKVKVCTSRGKIGRLLCGKKNLLFCLWVTSEVYYNFHVWFPTSCFPSFKLNCKSFSFVTHRYH